MPEKFVAKLAEFKDGERRIVFVGDNEIGVFRHEGAFYAYSNFCLHQGGPACEGLTIAKVEERLRPDKTSMGLFFSETEMHFVCPWHGMEYDMKTGECVGRPAHEAEEIPGRAEGRRGLCPRLDARAKDALERAAQGRARLAPGGAAAQGERQERRRPTPSAWPPRSSAASPTAGSTCSAPTRLQALIAAACRLYAARREAGEQFTPVAQKRWPPPT